MVSVGGPMDRGAGSWLDRLRWTVRDLPRLWKRIILVCFDVVALAIALWLSFSLRYGAWSPPTTANEFTVILTGPLVAVPIFVRMGLYRAVIRFLPDQALWTMLRAMSYAALGWVILAFALQLAFLGHMPRSVPIFYWLFGTLFIVGSRFAAKRLLGPAANIKQAAHAVVVYGAGEAGAQLAAALARQRLVAVAGFIDDDPHLQGRDVAGIRVYPPSQLPFFVKRYGVREVVLSMPSLEPARRQQIVAEIGGQGVKIRTIPPLADIVRGKHAVNDLREIDIDELLGRSAVPPDPQLLEQMIAGRRIMVTGAGGSIGSELCRLIARFQPARLVLFEANEFALYEIDKELATVDRHVVARLGNVADPRAVRGAILENGIETIFHAAAYKHVPLVEANALEGIRNNVLGTFNVARLAFECGVGHFVLISSDKAVRPGNVMGATKRWSEMIVLHHAIAAEQAGTNQRFCSVRFGNVLGSNGSVVPLFKRQIADGGPVTLTDPRMTRYFMSIHEAAELIVQAGALSSGADIFLLEMGEPILIRELAENMIRLAGRTVRGDDNPEGDIAIEVTGSRAGEKLFEELVYDPNRVTATRHPRIMRVEQNRTIADGIERALDELVRLLDAGDEPRAVELLFEMVQPAAPATPPAPAANLAAVAK